MRLRLLVAVPALAFGAPAVPHHSPAMLYDLAGHTEVEGVVTEYTLGNPHMRIYLDVEVDGAIEKWMAEGGSRTVLLRKGWDGSEVSPGDRVTVRGHPTRDGSRVLPLEYLVLPDGTELYGEDLDRSQLEDIRRRRD